MTSIRKDIDRRENVRKFLNSREERSQHELFRELALGVSDEFSNLSDYIWKTPNLIEHERSIEEEKLHAYFPITGDSNRDELALHLRHVRWSHEGPKLLVSFPNWIASGNLFICLSLFESYCLRLVRLIEQRSKLSLADAGGRGTARIFEYFRASGIDIFRLSHYREMQTSLRIRNCLIHAEGLLESDKDEKSLRRIIANGKYLAPEHVQWRHQHKLPLDEVIIAKTDLGDRIAITNDYPHVLTRYARDFLIDAAAEAHQLFAKNNVAN